MRESRRALALAPGYREAYRCLEEACILSRNQPSAAAARRLHGTPADETIDPADPYGAAVQSALKGDREAAIS